MTPAELQAIRARNEAEDWGDPQQINTDVADLLYHVDTLTARLAAVRKLHAPVDALNTRYNRVQKVCTGCGTDDGNWQIWPCPTIRAIDSD